MNCIFIYNPVSGKGKIAKRLPFIVEELQKKYERVEVYATKCAGDMSRVAREAVGSYDAIVFAGGDGSFNEVVQGIASLDDLPELGYIPSGTVNDIAHTLKIPKKIKKALKIIQTGRNELLDCMKVNDGYAMYVVAAGAFTGASYTTPQEQKNHVGKIAYFLEGAKKNLRFRNFSVNCENEEVGKQTHSVLITVMNSRYVAGFKVNKFASLQDGKIEIAIVPQKNNPGFFQKIGAFFAVVGLFLFGWKRKAKNLVSLEGSHFDIEVSDDVVWNVDGEKGSTGKLHIEVVPKKINMIVPQKIKKL